MNRITPITAGEIRKRRGYTNPFQDHIGIPKIHISTRGSSVSRVIPSEIAKNVHGIVHGGWTGALLDTTAAGAAYSSQPGRLENGEYGVTANLNIDFIRPVFIGEVYNCKGEITERKGSNIYTRATVTDSKGERVAVATARVKALSPD